MVAWPPNSEKLQEVPNGTLQEREGRSFYLLTEPGLAAFSPNAKLTDC